MTLLTPSPVHRLQSPIVLKGVSWKTYEALLHDLEAQKQRVYLTYDRGSLEIMPPLPFHQRYKRLLGRIVETLCYELRIRIASCGSSTFRREDLERGLEPDECYYVQNEGTMRDRLHIDLRNDPPPDLAIEMDYTHHDVDRQSVYAALGVPEIWLYDGKRLQGLLLSPDGSYAPANVSSAFPFVRFADLERSLRAFPALDEDSVIREFVEQVKRSRLP